MVHCLDCHTDSNFKFYLILISHNRVCWHADGSVATLDEIKDSSCQGLGDGDSQKLGYSIPCLPEVWQHKILKGAILLVFLAQDLNTQNLRVMGLLMLVT
jgi:hypothetical protein